jgi:hypothetical protein
MLSMLSYVFYDMPVFKEFAALDLLDKNLNVYIRVMHREIHLFGPNT